VALSQFDLSELLDALRAGGDVDVIRASVEMVLQALIDAEATEVIGAARHERSASRTNQRNGTRPKLVTTKAGDVELAIPKLRHGSFFPSILERRRRIDRALFAVVMEAYVHGVSTRKVDDLVQALGGAAGISKSEVSRICGELDESLQAFRDRPGVLHGEVTSDLWCREALLEGWSPCPSPIRRSSATTSWRWR
jgi:transposase-like protein